jgi:hypothetical protein
MLPLFALLVTTAHATTCLPHPPDTWRDYSWRRIEGRRCYYQGSRVIAKRDLHWDEPPRPGPSTDPAPTPPAPPPMPEPHITVLHTLPTLPTTFTVRFEAVLQQPEK